ncbi:similar to DNA helicase UvrD [Aromatoleum aromaticum EbN1]|uniref:DNA 3'-5' helicase n=1 Tax=Aromatoleum aromaticum (strain DSM 19018 / LMG 30748 / EbN1) TaxID=76114 RepID=Q5P8U0_AROAE|nr:UvrD-helicase domain-containing protein [Aromatoleum aromaticum]CAI06269.1 similar to DNA helicase UvrD [Aromatoleum aromaticum EbN1]
MSLKPKVALSQDFLARLAKIPGSVQGKILKWALKFQNDPTSSGINYESINGARDPNLKSVRVDQDWRGIVFKPPAGDVYVLLYVDHHDDAYRWAEGKKLAVNPVTGALQVFAVESVMEPVLAQARSEAATHREIETEAPSASLFGEQSDHELLSLGAPAELLGQLRSIATDVELDALQSLLPVEAYEGLFLVAAGDTVAQVLGARETRVDQKVNTDDFAGAIETPESQARFIVVADEETMTAILNAPLAQWRVFLHPTQRKLSIGDRSGSMRVLGGAGTGKTVLAMHRAKWLAENRASSDSKVFFTTFTRNLAADIEDNLKTLCPPATMQKIEVKNLDAWVHGFLRRHKYEHAIIYNRNAGEAAEAWQRALALQDTSMGLPSTFYEEELERVVLAQGVTTRDEYRMAKRAGRGTILSRSKRDAIWPVFEEYRAQLASRKLKEVDDAYRDAVSLLRNAPVTYCAAVIDETQDFGPQALKLLRAMLPTGENDLFFVGDGHQRIYSRNRAAMSACGINIRGRSRKLYLNYRTTEEIRLQAVAVLEGCEVDDLDDGSDEVKRYKSISHGPAPEHLQFQHLDEALRAIDVIAAASRDGGESLCVIAPTQAMTEAVARHLKECDISTKLLGPEERDQPDSTTVRIATMHRAKGLEFDEVALLIPEAWGKSGDRAQDQRRLQYVAMTRAKRKVTVIRY